MKQPVKKEMEILTFKADAALAKVMRGIENRSEFIRHAILAALDNICPFCKGTGVLTEHRKKHWNSFAEAHAQADCRQCQEPAGSRKK